MPDIRSLVQKLRKLIFEIVPHASERVLIGWKLIGFYAPHYFCFIAPFQNYVRLGFEQEILLQDSHQILKGEGKQVRFIKLKKLSDIYKSGPVSLLLEATDLRPALKRISIGLRAKIF